jgi:hypothetical protein
MRKILLLLVCTVFVLFVFWVIFASISGVRDLVKGSEPKSVANIDAEIFVEVSPACYHNLALDALIFPKLKPVISSAMDDSKITVQELCEIYESGEWQYEEELYLRLFKDRPAIRVMRGQNAQDQAKTELIELLED